MDHIKDLHNLDPAQILQLLQEAKEKDGPKDLSPVLKLLNHSHKGVKELAKELILQKAGPGDVEKIIPYLNQRDPEARNLAVEILYCLVDQNLAAVGNLLACGKEDLAIYACQILGYSKKEASIAFLKKALDAHSPNTRNAAAMALEKNQADFDFTFLIEALKKETEQWVKFSILEVIAKKGRLAHTRALFGPLESEPDFIKLSILEILAKLGNLNTADKLHVYCTQYEGALFSAYAKCLLAIISRFDIQQVAQRPKVIGQLANIIEKNGQPWETYQAIQMLASLKEEKFAPLFEKRLSHQHPLVRIAAIEGLCSLPRKDTKDMLNGFLNDPSPEVRDAVSEIINGKKT